MTSNRPDIYDALDKIKAEISRQRESISGVIEHFEALDNIEDYLLRYIESHNLNRKQDK